MLHYRRDWSLNLRIQASCSSGCRGWIAPPVCFMDALALDPTKCTERVDATCLMYTSESRDITILLVPAELDEYQMQSER